jgi:hypothetical protein
LDRTLGRGAGMIMCGGVRGAGETDIEIFGVNPDGTGDTALTSNGFRDGSPAISPDNDRRARIPRRDGSRAAG